MNKPLCCFRESLASHFSIMSINTSTKPTPSLSTLRCTENLKDENPIHCFHVFKCKPCKTVVCLAHNKDDLLVHPSGMHYHKPFDCLNCDKPYEPIGGKLIKEFCWKYAFYRSIVPIVEAMSSKYPGLAPVGVRSDYDFFTKVILPICQRKMRVWLIHHRLRRHRRIAKMVFKNESGMHSLVICNLIEEYNLGPASSGKQEVDDDSKDPSTKTESQ